MTELHRWVCFWLPSPTAAATACTEIRQGALCTAVVGGLRTHGPDSGSQQETCTAANPAMLACELTAGAMQGRVVDFKNTLIIMTSNVGSSVIEKGGGRIGFQLDLQTEEDSSYNRIKNLVNEELKQYFRCGPA